MFSMQVTALVCLGVNAELPRRKPIVFVALLKISEICYPNPSYQSESESE